MTKFNLRPYQEDLINSARKYMMAGVRGILIQSPTGSGKTVLTAHMLKTAASKNMQSLFTVHRRELVKQSTKTFSEVEVRHGIIAAGFPVDSDPLVQVGSIGTLQNRLGIIKKPRLIVWDECHHVAAASWAKVHTAFPDAFHIGLTATPERLDGKGLGKWFDVIIKGPSVSWLIENGSLSKYKLYAPAKFDVTGIRKSMGDFSRSDLAAAIDKPTITGDVIREWTKAAYNKQTVVFCVSIEHSKHVAEQFKSQGVMAVHVDGETPNDIRDLAIKEFEAGRIKVLCNVDLFGEGFDVPAIECVVDVAPTNSLSRWLQRCGRALRFVPNKVAIILDHAGNCERHGLPDEDREWSLGGRAGADKKKNQDGPSVRICQKCFAAQFIGNRVCKYCGSLFEIKTREIARVEGELQEVDPSILRRNRNIEQSKAKSLEDLIAMGKARGYKRAELWARHVYIARQNKKGKTK